MGSSWLYPDRVIWVTIAPIKQLYNKLGAGKNEEVMEDLSHTLHRKDKARKGWMGIKWKPALGILALSRQRTRGGVVGAVEGRLSDQGTSQAGSAGGGLV